MDSIMHRFIPGLLLGMLMLMSGCSFISHLGSSATRPHPNTGYTPEVAAFYGNFVEVAYEVYKLDNDKLNPSQPDYFPKGYSLVANIQAVANAWGNKERKYFGYIAQSIANPREVVVAIRGTEGWREWVDDAEFLHVKFRDGKKGEHVEEGFYDIYKTFTSMVPGNNKQVTPFSIVRGLKPTHLVIVGHSLGSSLATLFAFQVQAEGVFPAPVLYTLASPRVGNRAFSKGFNQEIEYSYRIYNAPDIVPKLPPWWFGYRHVDVPYRLNSHKDKAILHSLGCYHSLLTYLHMLAPDRYSVLPECKK